MGLVYLSGLIISKDLILLGSGLVLRFMSLKRYNIPLAQFFDPKVASIEIKPLLLSKINTVLQFLTLGASFFPLGLSASFINYLQ